MNNRTSGKEIGWFDQEVLTAISLLYIYLVLNKLPHTKHSKRAGTQERNNRKQ